MHDIFVWKTGKLHNTIFQRMFIFRFLLVLLLLISNNTLHVISYTCICYWNTFHYKHIIQITFYVVKQSHTRVTTQDICLILPCFSLPFFVLSRLRFISWSSPLPSLFNWPRVQLYLDVPSHIQYTFWSDILSTA